MSSSHSDSRKLESPDALCQRFSQPFLQALSNILATDVAEFTYAQILDGLPTVQSLTESFSYIRGHPVLEMNHAGLCEGYLEKARDFRSQFDPSHLRFEPSLLDAFQKTTPGSKTFNLRLIELVVDACHQIGAYLFEMDDGAHKHHVYESWLEKELIDEENGADKHTFVLPPAAFFHRAYQFPDQYPRGIADVVGYWAEGKILGGVVVFDRGETEQECNEMWIHGARYPGPKTLYPPTKDQYASLVKFLLSDPDEDVPCPLPIHGTPYNRPRWSADDAFQRFHIFRDRYERRIPIPNPRFQPRITPIDWPEIGDEMTLVRAGQAQYSGEPVDEEEVAAANSATMRFPFLAACTATLPGAAFAANCFTGSFGSMSSADEWAIRDDVANNVKGWGWPIEAVASHSYAFEHGSVQFCIKNDYSFDNTHVSQGDVVYAIGNIIEQCGELGGTYEVKGDSGLKVDVDILPSSYGGCWNNSP
ncbi:hypothetical protein G7046_g391 [Stylonectria norvegica]|nr:hypothetical protein G7046_g391 [Stylonectria norvegica]